MNGDKRKRDKSDDMRRNASGYADPTAYEAYKNIRKERGYEAHKVIKTLQNVAHLAGFEIVGRIVIRDVRTGETYK